MTTIIVPRNKCPLDVLAEQGDRITNAWIFFHDDAIRKLEDSATCIECINEEHVMRWQATEEYSETELRLNFTHNVWFFCTTIFAEDISFTVPAEEPDEVIFIKMAG